VVLCVKSMIYKIIKHSKVFLKKLQIKVVRLRLH
jgi:hypothetical protein